MSEKNTRLRYKVYIAGKVTGLPYHETREKFQQAEDMLKDLGQEVVNPLKVVPAEVKDWHSAMRICISHLYSCNAIFLLPDWGESRGALLEYYNANAMDFKIFNDQVISNIRRRLKATQLLQQLKY